MIGTSSIATPQGHQVMTENEVVETRFGRVTISRHNPITMPRGPLGMPDKNNFCLAEFPSEKMRRFKLLQCLDDAKLSFITLPLDLNNPVIMSDDLATAAKDLEIDLGRLALLLIVSVHRNPQTVKLSVNARAPLLIDSVSRQATQYVFPHDRYQVQHFITA